MGAGKTTNALGLALRSVWHKRKGYYNPVSDIVEEHWRI